jgi:hypothetical protein
MKTLLLSVTYSNGTGINGKGEFWAESYIKNMAIQQQAGETIHDTVKRAIDDIDCAELCYCGKPQSNMYQDREGDDPVIVGYVYRAKHFISDQHSNFQGYALFDAWVDIKEANVLELEDIEN